MFLLKLSTLQSLGVASAATMGDNSCKKSSLQTSVVKELVFLVCDIVVVEIVEL